MDIAMVDCAKATVSSDNAIARTARSILSKHTHFRGRADTFKFVVVDCTLQVHGRVPSFYLKQVLQTLLQEIAGIRRIDNRVEVISVEGLSSLCDDPR